MKWLFVLLLLGNLMFYGYTRLETPVQSIDWKSREINPDQLKQVAFGDAQITARDKKFVESQPAESTTSESAPAAPPETKPEVKPVASTGPTACFAWHGLLAADLPNARKKLASLQLGGVVKTINNEATSPTRFWVYISPRPSLEDAQKKADELKALGITDFFVVNDGSQWSRSVSLGLFSTREAAQRRLEALRQQGVRSAAMREKGEGENTTLMVKNVPKSARSNLVKASMNFRGSSISEVDC